MRGDDDFRQSRERIPSVPLPVEGERQALLCKGEAKEIRSPVA
jgi:hypothetical protein